MLYDPSISTNSMQNESFILKAYWSYSIFEGIKLIFYLRRSHYLKHFSFIPIWGSERTIFLTKESLCLIKIYLVDHNFIFFYCLNCQSLDHELQEKSVSIFNALQSYWSDLSGQGRLLNRHYSFTIIVFPILACAPISSKDCFQLSQLTFVFKKHRNSFEIWLTGGS